MYLLLAFSTFVHYYPFILFFSKLQNLFYIIYTLFFRFSIFKAFDKRPQKLCLSSDWIFQHHLGIGVAKPTGSHCVSKLLLSRDRTVQEVGMDTLLEMMDYSPELCYTLHQNDLSDGSHADTVASRSVATKIGACSTSCTYMICTTKVLKTEKDMPN